MSYPARAEGSGKYDKQPEGCSILKQNTVKRWIYVVTSIDLLRFTLLYFQMAVMPHFPKTKMADVGKLISLGNLFVRKVTWLVLTTTSESLKLSRAFGASCTRIVYIYSRLSRTNSLHFAIQSQHTLSRSPFRLAETTHTLSLSLLHFDF